MDTGERRAANYSNGGDQRQASRRHAPPRWMSQRDGSGQKVYFNRTRKSRKEHITTRRCVALRFDNRKGEGLSLAALADRWSTRRKTPSPKIAINQSNSRGGDRTRTGIYSPQDFKARARSSGASTQRETGQPLLENLPDSDTPPLDHVLHQDVSTKFREADETAIATVELPAAIVTVEADATPCQRPQDGPCCEFDPYDADVWSDVDPAVELALRVLDAQPAAIRHRAAAHLSRDAQADAPDHDAAALPRKPR
ncbi:MAG: hypothetical protein DCC68_11430 [Planctomycetota bacterium]|nr:MAG: hypothetical protein DCC68_11430 [Planctomycetota bacterium]